MTKRVRRPSKRAQAKQLIIDLLSERGGKLPSKRLRRLVCEQLDVSPGTYQGALADAHHDELITCRPSGYAASWEVKLRGQPSNRE